MALAVRPRFSLQRIAALDERTLQRVAQARTALWTQFMRTITHTSLWLPLLVGAVAMAGDHSFLFGAAVGGMAAGVASVLVQLVKVTVRRARPSMAFCLAHTLDRYSFPSGHSSAAFAVAAASLLVAPALFPVILLLAAVVAFSRVYLGVHYPSDVLTGAVLGTVLGFLTATTSFAVDALSVLLG